MPALAIIQARLGSARLPGKALMDIGGKPMIQHVVERAHRIRGVDRVVLAVPTKDLSVLGDYCQTVVGVAGPEVDVLARFHAVADAFPKYDTLMRLTGDCPLLNPRVCEDVLRLYQQSGCAYAWNVAEGYVDGEDCEVFSRHALMEAYTFSSEREHVTTWIRQHRSVATLKPHKKTSVDTLEDLERVRAIYAQSV